MPEIGKETQNVPPRTAGASSSRKVLNILLAFSEHRQGATVAELSQLIGAPIPTTYRHVALLKELQLLEEGGPGIYHPTAKVMPLARAAQLSNTLAAIARPIVSQAVTRLQETVMLLQYFGDSVVCIERTECDRPMRYTFQQGHSVPLGIGASGKMAMASLLPDVQQSLLSSMDSDPELAQNLELIRQQGFATSKGEMNDGVWACSVPVLDSHRSPAVLTMAGPASRISGSAKDRALEVIRSSAAEIRRRYEEFALPEGSES